MAEMIGSEGTDRQVFDAMDSVTKETSDERLGGKSRNSDGIDIDVCWESLGLHRSRDSPRHEKTETVIDNKILVGPVGDCENNNKQQVGKKMKMDDLYSVGTKLLDDSEKVTSDSLSTGSSRPASNASSGKSPLSKIKDTEKKEKEKDREERIRKAREKLAEDRQKKLEELKEQQRIAQEIREKQLELRRKKIEDLRRREDERRSLVDERRRKQEEADKVRKEAILNKAKDRLTRYESWKSSGRRGGGGGMIPGGSPPNKYLSVSTSVLYHKKNADFSFSGNLTGRDRPDSMFGLNTIPELGRSFLAYAGQPPTRPKSTVNLHTASTVKMRDNTQRPPRKPRPASIAGSMPSFIQPAGSTSGTSPRGASRSKSTDRLNRDTTSSRRLLLKNQTQIQNKNEKKDVSRMSDTMKKSMEKKKDEKKVDGEPSKPTEKSTPHRISRSTLERLSTPKHTRESPNKEDDKEITPTKMRAASKKASQEMTKASSPVSKASPCTSPLPPTKEEKEEEVNFVTDIDELLSGETDLSDSMSVEKEPQRAPDSGLKETLAEEKRVMFESDVLAQPEPETELIQPIILAEEKEYLSSPSKWEPKSEFKPAGPIPAPAKTSQGDMELEEYRAKLAEKRRIAREKAEREAELERQREEALRLQEQERQRWEEEEELKLEEEALRLAADARKAEEERLQKAIEAEEERKRLEAERIEQERNAKEEEERRGKEEAERKEKERQDKLRRDEEERIERKKRLEMIMKRVKDPSGTQDSKVDSSSKSLTSSPSKGSLASLDSSSEERSEEPQSGVSEDNRQDSKTLYVPLETSKFRSPLLQKLVDNKPSLNGESPKFKSPLLQNLLGKNKTGSLIVLDRSDDSSDEDKLDATDKITESNRADSRDSNLSAQAESDLHRENVEFAENSDLVSGKLASSISESFSKSMEISCDESDTDTLTSQMVPMDISSSSFNGISQNGKLEENTELVESCISMRTDPMINSQADACFSGSLIDSMSSQEQLSSQPCSDFEEIIDLSVANKNFEVKSQLHGSLIGTSEDLLNFNNIESTPTQDGIPKPLIAFEENTNHRQDVTDLLL